MDWLTRIIMEATAAVPYAYFHLNIDGGVPSTAVETVSGFGKSADEWPDRPCITLIAARWLWHI